MTENRRSGDWQVLGAVALISLGTLLLMNQVGGPWWSMVRDAFRFAFSVAWPLAVIALGVLLLINARSGNDAPAKTQSRRLYRSRGERMVGGVLGGLAVYLGVDPAWVRIAYVVIAVATGVGPAVVAYIIALIVIPEEPKAAPPQPQWPQGVSAPASPDQAPGWPQQPPSPTESVQTPPPPPPPPPQS